MNTYRRLRAVWSFAAALFLSVTVPPSVSVVRPPPPPPMSKPSMAARPPPPPPPLRPAGFPWYNANDANKTAERVDVCALNACEAYVRMRDDLATAVRPINDKLRGEDGGGFGGMSLDKGALLEIRLQRLDRRLQSVEQPGEYIQHNILSYYPIAIEWLHAKTCCCQISKNSVTL